MLHAGAIPGRPRGDAAPACHRARGGSAAAAVKAAPRGGRLTQARRGEAAGRAWRARRRRGAARAAPHAADGRELGGATAGGSRSGQQGGGEGGRGGGRRRVGGGGHGAPAGRGCRRRQAAGRAARSPRRLRTQVPQDQGGGLVATAGQRLHAGAVRGEAHVGRGLRPCEAHLPRCFGRHGGAAPGNAAAAVRRVHRPGPDAHHPGALRPLAPSSTRAPAPLLGAVLVRLPSLSHNQGRATARVQLHDRPTTYFFPGRAHAPPPPSPRSFPPCLWLCKHRMSVACKTFNGGRPQFPRYTAACFFTAWKAPCTCSRMSVPMWFE
mmetsp:Transcript_11714/g.29625  ORF Transcript_11714/g.29625 Transcript_11714/m.29625 type:complete len:323 (-) Transcript_11714:679-1647(-)